MRNDQEKSFIVIPALDPPQELYSVVSGIRALDNERRILLYDDGSSPEYEGLWESIRKDFPHILYEKHPVNMGKGRTIKDAIAFVQKNFPGCPGIVTADSDGQHLPEDILHIAEKLESSNMDILLGVRDFSAPGIPARSRFGNKLTSRLFKFLLNMDLADTQTGLRGISCRVFPEMLALPGDRYEYETEMLLEIWKKGFSMLQVPIAVVYIDNNRESHFNPLVDSFRIYSRIFQGIFRQLLAFIGSSLLAAAIDLSLYALLYLHILKNAPGKLFFSVVTARVISSFCNYMVNRNLVFKFRAKTAEKMDGKSCGKYFSLVVLIMMSSYLLSKLLIFLFPAVSPVLLKLLVDIFLFIVSFLLQRFAIFKHHQ